MRKLTFIAYFLLIISCNKKNDIIESVNTGQVFGEKFDNKSLRDSLAKKAIYSNDTLAYKELKGIYYLSGNTNEFLYYALLMFNRNNYKSSANDIYFILNRTKMDKKTDNFASDYLKKSKE
ncbi:hypothetical protein J2X97_002528 [Epilithonimonas hungarica]|uniref:hypothetical protein n=1 Tax=Epilithonimonas hungarica TaxID=454006 RepID=UPI00278A78CA|nr:hypothetical protein [Epilithonimonas hungarica]MDP9956869.1 hypothetical protein [Epilithonimonas hungarica]